MKRIGLLSGAIAALASSAAAAQATQVEAFVAAVQSGQDLAKSQFAGLVAAADAAKLAKVAKCIPGQPKTSESGSSMVVMWDCRGQPAVGSLGVMFSMDGGQITSIFVMPAVVVPVSERG
jgi:regulator of protease activity HflC (stomatin/prohibitin superfamily)